VKTDCQHFFLTADGTRPHCMLGRIPELVCDGCAAYRPERTGPREVWTEEERANYLESAERAR